MTTRNSLLPVRNFPGKSPGGHGTCLLVSIGQVPYRISSSGYGPCDRAGNLNLTCTCISCSMPQYAAIYSGEPHMQNLEKKKGVSQFSSVVSRSKTSVGNGGCIIGGTARK